MKTFWVLCGALIVACAGRQWVELPKELSVKPQPNLRVRAKVLRPGVQRQITPETPLNEELEGIISFKSVPEGRRHTQLRLKVDAPEPLELQLDLPVPTKSLTHFTKGMRVKIQLSYPDPENPVVPGTLTVILRSIEDDSTFILLHGQDELPDPLAKSLRVGWGRSKNARLESSTRAFCERTEDRYAFDLSGTAIGTNRNILPGQTMSLERSRGKKTRLYAGDCTRVVGGNCPDDVRGLWDCQLVVVVEP
jgi:hypothetical protein